ncbi:UNVERIFIED_CONTAM: Mediator of RNA polymerase II transcription subunit [Sesamum angustifolium]|uniref:Mediator of RNA polymerase II transcription subunit n=1 Tax=Sesamum angustifolium TaxID=2727405 RepID=A0AAW2M8X3_9LAMI
MDARLQQNWKIKRHRLVAAASGNEGFYIDLFDNSLYDSAAILRPSSLSTIPIEHDAAGMLAVNLPRKSCHSLQFEVLGLSSASNLGKLSETKTSAGGNDSSKEPGKEYASNDERVREIHLTLREVHRAIHDEQVQYTHDLFLYYSSSLRLQQVMQETRIFAASVNLTGIKENYLRLSIGQGASVSISLLPSSQDDETNGSSHRNTTETSCVPSASVDGAKFGGVDEPKKLGIPSPLGFEIYLRQVFHEHVFVKAKNKAMSSSRSQISSQPLKDNSNILGHFCMSLAHRIFSNKVLFTGPYVHLVSHPTWHSRTSSWTLSVKIPQSILHAGSQIPMPTEAAVKNIRSQFWTRVLVIDDSIRVEGEGAPNVVGLFRGRPDSVSSINGYDCDLVDLPIILLQQVASQVIQWLHEEALTVGIKANRDFLSLAFELDQGEIVRLVAHVDPEDTQGCISWWLTVDDGIVEEHKLHPDMSDVESESRKFLGYLSLEVLYSTLLDFLNLCSC